MRFYVGPWSGQATPRLRHSDFSQDSNMEPPTMHLGARWALFLLSIANDSYFLHPLPTIPLYGPMMLSIPSLSANSFGKVYYAMLITSIV
jgi:hypothetical protein